MGQVHCNFLQNFLIQRYDIPLLTDLFPSLSILAGCLIMKLQHPKVAEIIDP